MGRATVMPSPSLYHLLPHPHCGSITASTPKQWSNYLFAKLQEYNLSLTFHGKNKYFL
jgi:leucine-rich repeat protein SHOC2